MEPHRKSVPSNLPLESVAVRGVSLRKGSSVRIVPANRSDVLDLSPRGRTATVHRIEMDFDGQVYVEVLLDGDQLSFHRIEEIIPTGG